MSTLSLKKKHQMLRSNARRLSRQLTRIITVAHTLFTTRMSRSRYFPNPYRLDDEKDAKVPSNLDVKGLKEDLRELIDDIVKNEPPDSANYEGGLYVGSAGIAYALLHVSSQLKTPHDESSPGSPFNNDYISLAQRYLKPSLRDLEKRSDRVECGFLLGDGGTIAVSAVIASIVGDSERSDFFAKQYVDMAELCKPEAFLRAGSDEFLVGRAGYLFGSLWLNKTLGKIAVPLSLMREIARVVVLSGKNYARKHSSPCPLMYAYYGTEYLGAAHGLSSILQVLIQVPDFLETNKEAEILTRTSVDYLLSLETSSGNYPCALDEINPGGRAMRDESNELVHWCHGSPGVIYLMAAAYLRWKDNRYLEACQRAGELVWEKGLLKKGPGICHGITGSGYVFLLLYRLTLDPNYLSRAKKFAEFLKTKEFKEGARKPDSPYSLYEGIAGTACFLADLIQPDKAAFPFQDVF